jgi:hypothetical protein
MSSELLSDVFDFFFEFQFLAFHRRKPRWIHGWPFGLSFNDQVQVTVPRVEFAQPLIESHMGASFSWTWRAWRQNTSLSSVIVYGR